MAESNLAGWEAFLFRSLSVLLRLAPGRVRDEYSGEFLALVRARRAELDSGAVAHRVRFWFGEWWGAARLVLHAWTDRARGRDQTGSDIRARLGDATVARPLETVTQSVRHARRSLVRNPTFATVSVMILTIGIGATTAVFSLADWALFRPVPVVSAPEALRTIEMRPLEGDGGSFAPISHPMVERIRGSGGLLASTAAYTFVQVDARPDRESDPIRVRGQMVTPGFFETLAVPVRGRGFTAAEGTGEAVHAVAVVSDGFWSEVMGGEGDPLGRSFVVGDHTFTIVGVVPDAFQGVTRVDRAPVWIPPTASSVVFSRRPANVLAMEAAPIWPRMIVRPPEGTGSEMIAAAVRSAAPELGERGLSVHVGDRVGLPDGLRAQAGNTLMLLGVVVALLLVLTVANLTNLFLTRVTARRHETSVRRALGASTGRLTLDVAAEGVGVALVGAVVAALAARLLLRVADVSGVLAWLPDTPAIPFDLRVFGFAFSVALVSTLAGSLLGASALRGTSPWAVLRSSRGTTRARSRLRSTVVALQMALSVVLVVGAGLTVRSVTSLLGSRLGYQPDGVVAFSLNPGLAGRDAAASDQVFRSLAVEIRALPGVESVAFTWLAPLGSRRYSEEVSLIRADGAASVTTLANMVSPDFFDVLGIEVEDGRVFGAAEFERSERPSRGQVVVNRALADALAPGGGVVGMELRMEGRREDSFEVIGVVSDARLVAVDDPAGPQLFDPFGNGYRTTDATFVLGVAGPADDVLAEVADLVRSRHPDLAIIDPSPVSELIRDALGEERALTRTFGLFALLALALAGGGLYGLVHQGVQARTREFGIRSAMGAGRVRVARLVLAQGMLPVAGGIVAGLILSWYGAPFLEARLLGLDPLDPVAFGIAPAILVAAAIVAMAHPLVLSLRVDPARILQEE